MAPSQLVQSTVLGPAGPSERATRGAPSKPDNCSTLMTNMSSTKLYSDYLRLARAVVRSMKAAPAPPLPSSSALASDVAAAEAAAEQQLARLDKRVYLRYLVNKARSALK